MTVDEKLDRILEILNGKGQGLGLKAKVTVMWYGGVISLLSLCYHVAQLLIRRAIL